MVTTVDCGGSLSMHQMKKKANYGITFLSKFIWIGCNWNCDALNFYSES